MVIDLQNLYTYFLNKKQNIGVYRNTFTLEKQRSNKKNLALYNISLVFLFIPLVL